MISLDSSILTSDPMHVAADCEAHICCKGQSKRQKGAVRSSSGAWRDRKMMGCVCDR